MSDPITPLLAVTTGVDGKTVDGKFAKGNKFSKGNAWAKAALEFKSKWDRSIRAGQAKEAQEFLWARFMAGEPWAAKLWMEYTFGKPKQSVEVTGNTTQPIVWAIDTGAKT